MAKKNDSAKAALDFFRDNGFEPPQEMIDAAQEIDRNLFVAPAIAILAGDESHTGKVEEELAEEWAERLFDFAEAFQTDFLSEEIGTRGRGTAKQRRAMVKVETPAGVLQVQLTY